MVDLITQLRLLPVFSELPEGLLQRAVADTEIAMGLPGDAVRMRPVDYFVLLEGAVEVVRPADGRRLAALSVPAGSEQPAWLYALAPGAHLSILQPSRYLVLDGEVIDAALSERSQSAERTRVDPVIRERLRWLRLAKPFDRLSMTELLACAEAMTTVEAATGTDVVEQGEVGDFFYVIEEGTAEVWRGNRLTGEEPMRVARLAPGASFGEEALLDETYRNATVRMTSPGRLLRLSKVHFDELIRKRLLAEIDAGEALRLARLGSGTIVDCRSAGEFAVCRIPGARHVPIEKVRELARTLPAETQYFVYCRSGRLSRAAAFLLSELGHQASVIRGGLAAWPHETESDDPPVGF
ncbi:MAG: cyclic nucleotide-binding domain-containing protein [Hyphomicrobiaceae bacterium]|nr:cyclic nucleotide-binding domain-containing protein [Hyphomicrobiaceae bacterium]